MSLPRLTRHARKRLLERFPMLRKRLEGQNGVQQLKAMYELLVKAKPDHAVQLTKGITDYVSERYGSTSYLTLENIVFVVHAEQVVTVLDRNFHLGTRLKISREDRERLADEETARLNAFRRRRDPAPSN